MRRTSWFSKIAFVLLIGGCGGGQIPLVDNPPGDIPATINASERPPTDYSVKTSRTPASNPSLHVNDAAGAPAELASKPKYVQFAVMVTDADGAPIDSIKRSDFEIYSGPQRFPISDFEPYSGTQPESIILLIDTSGSMDSKLSVVINALRDFIGKRNPRDEIAFFAFSDRPYLLQPFTTNHQAAAQLLWILRANGQTAMYDAINLAIEYAQKNAHYLQRSIVLITDGMDNQSSATKDATIATVKRSGVQMFIVGIGDPNLNPSTPLPALGPSEVSISALERGGQETLKGFAAATDARAFIVPIEEANTIGKGEHTAEFAAAIAQIGNSLGHDYSLGVILPAGVDPASVTVAAPSHPGDIVTSRVRSEQPAKATP